MPHQSKTHDTLFVLPDISGYARFISLNKFAMGYAQYIVFEPLNAIIEATADQTNGKLAWVVGAEHAGLELKSGGERIIDLFVTNIFEKIGDRWLMISHHAQVIPK